MQDELDKHVYLTTKSVCRFINLEFDLEYSERGMASLLNNIGYIYKKPNLKPSEPGEQLQEHFFGTVRGFFEEQKR